MAAISAVGIANMALSNIGDASTIQSFSEKSPQAKQCDLWYDYSRRQVLEAYNWSFARKRLVLATHSDAPPELTWAYRYQYPSDCIKARFIENPLGPTADAVPFEIENSLDGTVKTILTNMDDATLVYTFDLTATNLFSAHFVECLSHAIAFHIALALTGKRTIKSDMLTVYNRLILSAPAQNANEQVEEPPRDADWIRGRG